jgi:hypothetical protein
MQLSVFSCVAFISAATLLSISCSEEDKEPKALTPREILTSRSWVFSEFKEDGVVMTLRASCEEDDFLTLKTDGTYTRNRGEVECDPGEQRIFTDLWSLTDDNKTLYMASEVSGELLDISETSFTIRRSGAYVFDYTYKKK